MTSRAYVAMVFVPCDEGETEEQAREVENLLTRLGAALARRHMSAVIHMTKEDCPEGIPKSTPKPVDKTAN